MLAHWQKHFSNESPLLNLPTNYTAPAELSPVLGSHAFALTDNTAQQVKNLAHLEGTTLYTTLLAAFQVLLYRYTSQEKILVGSPVQRQYLSKTSVETPTWLILRAELSSQLTFRSFLAKMQQHVHTAFEYQVDSFGNLIEKSQAEGNGTDTPFFQSVFVLHTSKKPEEAFRIWEKKNGGLKAPIELILIVNEVNGALNASLMYNSNLFETTTIVRMAGHYQTLLEGIGAAPAQNISKLPLLTEAERHQMLVIWNDTQVTYPQDKCVHQLFEEQVNKNPDVVALVFDEQQMTYQELNAHANQLAHYLLKLGIGTEKLVGLCVERSFEMVIGLLGILKAGGAYVPIDPTYPKDRLTFILQDSHVSVLLTQEKFAHEWKQGVIADFYTVIKNVVCLDSDWAAISQESEQNIGSPVRLDHLAYVIYTSGSTGKPKGVLIPHKGLLNLVFWHQNAFEVTQGERATQLANIAFDASTWEIWPYLTAGARLYLVRQEIIISPTDLQDYLVSNDITITFLPTPLAETILSLEWPKKLALRLMLTGGDRLREFLPSSLPFQLVNNYGPTENSVVTTFGFVGCERFKLPPIGRPIDNNLVYILDDHLQPVPIGVPGELYIGGTSLARGYLNRPDLMAEKFIPNPFDKGRLYRTGDLVRYRPDGNIEFLERIDHQVKIRGYRIELGEIEALLRQHPLVQEAVVLAREDMPGEKYLAAYVVPVNLTVLVERDLYHYLSTQLPNYMVPTAWLIMPELPLNPNGKVDRLALPVPQKSRSTLEEDFIMPKTEVEQRIATILQDVLQLKAVGIHDNFMDLGANSILLGKAHSQLVEHFGEKLSLIDLFKYPTTYALAQYLGKFRQATKQPQTKTRKRANRTALKQQKHRRRQARTSTKY
jgi:amino acid adenylation domain-containing protein